MPLSWNDIEDRAPRFPREWQHESSGDADAKSFWDGCFDVFGGEPPEGGEFREELKKLNAKDGDAAC